MKKLNWRSSSGQRKNTREFEKPDEDLILCDQERGIYLLLDGITRVHEEYRQGPSASQEVTRLVAETVYRCLCQGMPAENVDQVLREAALEANRAVARYRMRRSLEDWVFYPGTLGILAVIQEGVLHYLCLGDCLGVLLRGNSKLLFGRQFSLESAELSQATKAERYGRICNHPEHPLAYGIFNGDETVSQLMEQSSLELHPGDTLLLLSDGLADYVRYTRTETLRRQSPEEMLDASARYDAPPYARYADDKSIIRIDCLET